MGPTEQLISPKPEFFTKPILSDQDELLILACDGVWNMMTSVDICEFVTARIKETVANEMINTCLYKGSLISQPSQTRPLRHPEGGGA